MESNRIEYEKPQIELLELRGDVITKSMDPGGSSNSDEDVVTWPTT